jgi:hypothetical protein
MVYYLRGSIKNSDISKIFNMSHYSPIVDLAWKITQAKNCIFAIQNSRRLCPKEKEKLINAKMYQLAELLNTKKFYLKTFEKN